VSFSRLREKVPKADEGEADADSDANAGQPPSGAAHHLPPQAGEGEATMNP